MVGSSTLGRGSGRGSSRLVTVSPISRSAMPAMAMISPTEADSVWTRSSPSKVESWTTLIFLVVSSWASAYSWLRFRVPLTTRPMARRPR